MSDNTSELPPPSPPSSPVPHHASVRSNSFSENRTSPPHRQPSRDDQQPPPRTSGCGQFAIVGLVILFILGVIGVCTLVGSIFLFGIANDAFEELTKEMQEKTVTEKFIGGNISAEEKIVVLSVEGFITGNADSFIAKQIRRVQSDPKVKAVVLRIDSPGGTMAGSDYYLHLLKKMKAERKIPVVVSMGSIATSGGYYISMVGDEIYAEPATITGSIGVIASLFDVSELLKKAGVEANPITSGQHKTMGSVMKPMTDEEREIWQKLINENFDRFKEIVLEGRKNSLDKESLDKLATGQVYTSNQALDGKLIDKIGFIDDVIDRAAAMVNLREREYKVVQYKAKLSFMETLLEGQSPNKLLNDKTLSELTTPKVYLICPHVIP